MIRELFFSFVVFVAPTASFHCSPEWYQYGRNCYYVDEYEETWELARETCHWMKAELTSINNATEFKELIKKHHGDDNSNNNNNNNNNNNLYWIGLNGTDTNNYYWLDGNSNDAGFFNRTIANSHVDDCFYATYENDRLKLYNDYCLKNHSYICKKSANTLSAVFNGWCKASNGYCRYSSRNCSWFQNPRCKSECLTQACFSTPSRFATAFNEYAFICYARNDDENRCYELSIRGKPLKKARDADKKRRCYVTKGYNCTVDSFKCCNIEFRDCRQMCRSQCEGAASTTYTWTYPYTNGYDSMRNCCRLCVAANISSARMETTTSASVPTSENVSGIETTASASVNTSAKVSGIETTASASVNTSAKVSDSKSTIWILVGVCAALGFLLLVATLVVVFLVFRMRHMAYKDDATDHPYQSVDVGQAGVHPYSRVQTPTKPGEALSTPVPTTNASGPGVGYGEAHRAPEQAAGALPMYAFPNNPRPETLHPTNDDYETTLVDNALYGSRTSEPAESNAPDYDLTVIDNALYDNQLAFWVTNSSLQ